MVDFMNVGGLTARKYPEALLPKAVQKDILEDNIRRLLATGPPFGEEQAEHMRESFENGQRAYADPNDLADALEDAGDDGRFHLPADLGDVLETDRGNAAGVIFVRVRGRGYVLATRREYRAIMAARDVDDE